MVEKKTQNAICKLKFGYLHCTKGVQSKSSLNT